MTVFESLTTLRFPSTTPRNRVERLLRFWFDGPQDAAACGFDPSKPTPFNSEHKAGPNAMISLLDLATGWVRYPRSTPAPPASRSRNTNPPQYKQSLNRLVLTCPSGV